LKVFVDNSRAIALDERFGFEHEGRHKAYALRSVPSIETLSMGRWPPQAAQQATLSGCHHGPAEMEPNRQGGAALP
jgi:hypothetical protein